ncbi:MAG: hypothetical protein HRU26_14345, partial [Psychroserpens sp.]|nr:hypothetical protein [Psychroserpens sp.]
KSNFSEKTTFESLKPAVRLLSSGTILPNSRDLKFNFEAVNLSKVDVRIIKIFENNVLQFLQSNNLNSNDRYGIRDVGRRIAKQTITLIEDEAQNSGKWKAYSIDLSKFFTADVGSIYRVELSFSKAYSLYDCKANTASDNDDEDYYDNYYDDDDYASEDLSSEEQDYLEEKYWDNISYSYRNENYRWRDRDNPCTDSYYNYPNRGVTQNLIASNLGVVAKKGNDNTYFFAVTDILSTEPEAGANITLYNYQQQELLKGITNSDGIAEIKTDKRAAFAIASKGLNTSYVKLYDGNSLSLSKFDVSGKTLERGLKGYIYGERGVWRPGDSLFLTFVLNDNVNKLPARHPVKLEITDPVGKLVYRRVSVDNINHFYNFAVPTTTDYKTGNYYAKVSVGGASFTKNLKIETVKPNRLKIKIDFEDELLKNNINLKGNLNVAWLHGAPAKNIKAEIKAKFTSKTTSFKGYKDYVFNDPARTFNAEENIIFENKVDANGAATITNKLNIGKNAPGMLNA